jgi:predicted nucleic acid-binding protein
VTGILLDTTVLIDYLRGRPGAIRRVAELRRKGDRPYVCAINVEEVSRGVRAGEDGVEDLLDGLTVAPLGIPEGRLAGHWRRTLARRGRSIAQADALIAAAATGVHARVATGNPRDFRFPGLAVEHWPVGE